jgi:hypothetical protein
MGYSHDRLFLLHCQPGHLNDLGVMDDFGNWVSAWTVFPYGYAYDDE